MKKILGYFFAVVLVSGLFLAFSSNAEAEEQFSYVRVCAAGKCIVYVYDIYGSLVNVYEELDNPM